MVFMNGFTVYLNRPASNLYCFVLRLTNFNNNISHRIEQIALTKKKTEKFSSRTFTFC